MTKWPGVTACHFRSHILKTVNWDLPKPERSDNMKKGTARLAEKQTQSVVGRPTGSAEVKELPTAWAHCGTAVHSGGLLCLYTYLPEREE